MEGRGISIDRNILSRLSGEFAQEAASLEAEINTNYIYSFIHRPADRAALAISAEDPETAAQALGQRGFKVLQQSDISR